MADKSLCQLVKLFSSSSDSCDIDKHSDCSIITNQPRNIIYENVQIFSDHLKTTKRFQKSFYYGNLRQSNFHPPLALTDATLELFNRRVPNTCRLDILNLDYAASVSRTVCVSPYSMVLAMMYLEQLRHKNPDYLENVSPCDLFVVSILVASKYLFDNDEEFTYNCDWAEAANLDVQDLNRLEKEFLHAMNWELFTEPTDFFAFLSKVEQWSAYKQSRRRGWFSYTELLILSENKVNFDFWTEMLRVIIKAFAVMTVSYAAAITILYGSSTLAYVSHRCASSILRESMFSNNLLPILHGFDESSIKSPCCNIQVNKAINFNKTIFESVVKHPCRSYNGTQEYNFPRLNYMQSSCDMGTLRFFHYRKHEPLSKINLDEKQHTEFIFHSLVAPSKQNLMTSANCHSIVINHDYNLTHTQV